MTLNFPAFEMTAEPTSQLPMWAEKRRTPLPAATASARFSRPSMSMSAAISAGLPVKELEDVGHGLHEPPEGIPGDRPELVLGLFPAEGLPEIGQGDVPVAPVATEGERAERPPGRQAEGAGEEGEEEHEDLERGVFEPDLHSGTRGTAAAGPIAASKRV